MVYVSFEISVIRSAFRIKGYPARFRIIIREVSPQIFDLTKKSSKLLSQLNIHHAPFAIIKA
jgi:hypothetical protein